MRHCMNRFVKHDLEKSIRRHLEAVASEVDNISSDRFMNYIDHQISWDMVYADIEGRVKAIMKEIANANI